MFSFFLFVFHFCFAATQDRVRVHFFDVGQGHCFLFVMKNSGFDNGQLITDAADIAILIDAGSTTDPKGNIPAQTPKTDPRGYIRSKIKKYINKTSTKVLIIATHGDIDHYNWLKDILYESRIRAFKKPRTENTNLIINPANTLCILGGKTSDYGQDVLPEFITQQSNFQRGGYSNPLVCFSSNNLPDIDTITDVIQRHLGPEVSVTILSALYNTDSNKSSIVTRIAYKPSGTTEEISFMIPGDAPGSVTDTIIKNHSSNPAALKSTVLLASHHGATTDDANNQAWFNVVNPRYVIFSHGDNKGFLHPHPNAIRYALEETEKDLTSSGRKKNHELFYGQRAQDHNLVPSQHAITFAQLTLPLDIV